VQDNGVKDVNHTVTIQVTVRRSTHIALFRTETLSQGLGIYIIEYMRSKQLDIKPLLPPDEDLEKDFDEAAWEELNRCLHNRGKIIADLEQLA
jgi:hypothetical protein